MLVSASDIHEHGSTLVLYSIRYSTPLLLAIRGNVQIGIAIGLRMSEARSHNDLRCTSSITVTWKFDSNFQRTKYVERYG